MPSVVAGAKVQTKSRPFATETTIVACEVKFSYFGPASIDTIAYLGAFGRKTGNYSQAGITQSPQTYASVQYLKGIEHALQLHGA